MLISSMRINAIDMFPYIKYHLSFSVTSFMYILLLLPVTTDLTSYMMNFFLSEK